MKLDRLIIPSKATSISAVENYVRDLARFYKINQDVYPNILISLTEAVNNAITHGNNGDENKRVEIFLQRTKAGLKFRVCDEGHGFNPKSLPDPTAPENIECCGGRGVFLIKQLSDRVSFSDNGSTVEMHFRL